MTVFRTEVHITPSPDKITHRSNIFFIGSCFTENIGVRMEEYKFRVDINPFGINYNPASVARNIEFLLDKKTFTRDKLHYYNERWFSFDHHSRFSHPDPDQCLALINNRLRLSSRNLIETDFFIITFGTAWVFERKKTGTIVSNCHKMPSNEFNRYLLSVDQIVQTFSDLINRLKDQIPRLKIIFTVSPVRHWKDGPVMNSVSKSALILSVHELVNRFANVTYFPGYEIAMDDLRDYRYYDEDLLHPNNQMVNYIWNKFCQVYFEEETIEIIKEIDKLITARNHKPFNPGSKQHKRFLEKQLETIRKLYTKYPFIDLKEEEKYFSSQLGK